MAVLAALAAVALAAECQFVLQQQRRRGGKWAGMSEGGADKDFPRGQFLAVCCLNG